MRQLAGYNITSDHVRLFPDALAQFVKVLGISRQEAPSPHTQAVVDTQRAAAIENESTWCEIMDEHLLSMARAMLAVYQA
jgi:hypothetical protein